MDVIVALAVLIIVIIFVLIQLFVKTNITITKMTIGIKVDMKREFQG